METATIVIRRARGVIVVQALGRTERGQSFIKGKSALKVKSITDPLFKGEMSTAVALLLGSES